MMKEKNISSKLLVFILTIGVFGIINTEMGVVGIIPLIAERFGVSVPVAGWTVSAFALVVAVSAPILPLLFSNFNRKRLMVLTLGLFTLSNIISMLATDFNLLLVSRIAPAFLHPVYVSMAFTVAAASVEDREKSKAVAKVFVGVSAGMVLGVPVTSFIVSNFSFEAGMMFFTIINLLSLVLTIFMVPSIPVSERRSYGSQLRVLTRRDMWYSVLSTFLINGAMFGYFSFMSDYMQNVTRLDFNSISTILLVYGMANIVGSSLGGRILAWNSRLSNIAIPLLMLAAYSFLFIWGQSVWFVWGIVFVIGVLAGIQNNNMQFMISDSAPDAPDFANGLFLASANLGTTVGTVFCGMFITWLGTRYSLYGTFAMLALGFMLVMLRTRVHSTRKTR